MVVKLFNYKRNHSSLIEATRKDLLFKSRRGSKTRFKKRLNYQVSNFRGVDLSELFNHDYFIFNTPIKDYVCTIAYEGVLSELREVVKSTHGDPRRINLQMVIKALSRSFDKSNDVKVRCTCPDFCLAPGTKIKMLDGRDISIEDLLIEFESGRKDLWTFSVGEDTNFRPGHISDVWISGYVSDLIEVELDNGEVVRTTPNHLYLLRNGVYKKAEDLKVGQSLMPLYFINNSKTNGYDIVKYNSDHNLGYNSVYKEVAKYELQDKIEEAQLRSREDIIVIHHVNFNKKDNRPENLYPMGKNEHWRYHAEFIAQRRKEDPEFDNKLREASRKHCYELNSNPTEALVKSRVEQGIKLASNINNDQKKRDYASKRVSVSQREYWSQMTEEERSQEALRRQSLTPDRGTKISESQKKVWNSYNEDQLLERSKLNSTSLNGKNGEKASERSKRYWKEAKENNPDKYKSLCERNARNLRKSWRDDPLKFTRGRCRRVLQKIVDEGLEMTEENYKALKSRNTPNVSKYWSSFSEMVLDLGFDKYNHSVVRVSKLHYDEPLPVYDLTVDKYNNFLVSAGVVLHNCYRFMYWANENNYLYGPPTKGTEKFPEITNPDDMLGATCKHLDLLLSNKRWLTRAASSVNALIKTYPDKAAIYLYDEEEIVEPEEDEVDKVEKDPETSSEENSSSEEDENDQSQNRDEEESSETNQEDND